MRCEDIIHWYIKNNFPMIIEYEIIDPYWIGCDLTDEGWIGCDLIITLTDQMDDPRIEINSDDIKLYYRELNLKKIGI